MVFADLFKSSREIGREKARARRKSLRGVESSTDVVKDEIAALKKERDKAWAQAREYLRDGQKAAAQRLLQSVQSRELTMGKLEKKLWVFNQLALEMKMAKTDQEFATALDRLNKTLEIDPDRIADVLGDVDDSLSEQAAVDKIWDKGYEKKMNGLAQSDAVPSVEEMMGNLEKEVVADVTGGTPMTSVAPSAERKTVGGIAEGIGEGRRRLKALMDGAK